MTIVHLHADDFGMSEGINKAILSLLDNRALSATTVMMAGNPTILPDSDVTLPHKDRFGLHLQLTAGKPLSMAHALHTEAGTFIEQEALLDINPAMVDGEWSLQLHAFHRHFGFWPRFIDSHHGVHHLAPFRETAQSLAGLTGARLRPTSDTVGQIADWTGSRGSVKDLVAKIKEAAHKGADYIEVITHPGLETDTLIGKTSWTDIREHEYHALMELTQAWDCHLPGFTLR